MMLRYLKKKFGGPVERGTFAPRGKIRDWGRRDHVALLEVGHHIDVVYRSRISVYRVGQNGDAVVTSVIAVVHPEKF